MNSSVRLSAMGVLCLTAAFASLRAADTRDKEKSSLSAAEQKILDLTNKERAKEGLPALKADPLLMKVARAHSANMARQQKRAHVLDGKNPYQRLKEAGYRYAIAGENIAEGDVDLEDIMKGWMASPGHRANILDRKYTHIGLGLSRTEEGVGYYTQVFANPQDQKGKNEFSLSSAEKKLLDLTNRLRQTKGLRALRPNAILCEVARAHSANMARQEKMEHVLDGKRPYDRVEAAAYTIKWIADGDEEVALVNENLACATPDQSEEDVIKGWLESPKHRKNLLDRRYTEIGLGMSRSAKGMVYFTQVFAAPKR